MNVRVWYLCLGVSCRTFVGSFEGISTLNDFGGGGGLLLEKNRNFSRSVEHSFTNTQVTMQRKLAT